MATDEYRGGPARHWTAKVRLVIEAGDTDMVRAINDEVLQQMDLVAKAEPQLTDFFVDGPRPCWYVLTELDLSGLESITPDDAPARFRFVTRELPAVPFMGHGDSHCGLWEWLPDSGGLAGHPLFPHPGIRAAGIYISDGTTSDMWPGSR
jgi:hypothetical protein